MANPYYTPSGAPASNADVASAAVRSEFALLQLAFDKFPALTANALKMLRVNSGATAIEAVTPTVAAADVTSYGGTYSGSIATEYNCSSLTLLGGNYLQLGKVFVVMFNFQVTRTATGFFSIKAPPPSGTIASVAGIAVPDYQKTDAEFGVGGISSGLNGNYAVISMGGAGTLTGAAMIWSAALLMRIN